MELEIYNFWRNKKVLITGHTGFKGSWLSFWLNEMGAEVYGISLNPVEDNNLFNQLDLSNTLKNRNFIFDIRDKKKLKNIVSLIKPEMTFHLAAQPLVRESYKFPLETWETNVIGTLNLLEALTNCDFNSSLLVITTDKVYKNNEWLFGYRENDELGGKDPYSASKAACEIALSSWRSSYCDSDNDSLKINLRIASARSGNIIGGGDWSKDRIIPDLIRAIKNKKKLLIRNPYSTRPWQHVLDPLFGYLMLGRKLMEDNQPPTESFNFGPHFTSNKTVVEMVNRAFKEWPGEFTFDSKKANPKEANLLSLHIEKSYQYLNWLPNWDFDKTITNTIKWYKSKYEGVPAKELCLIDIKNFENDLSYNIDSNKKSF